MKIVIDTNIWVKAMVESELEISCSDAINRFTLDATMELALDDAGEIEREYRDNIRDNKRFQLQWNRLSQQNRFCWVSSNLNTKIREKLDAIGFHEEEDRVFVGVALNTDRIIVSDDSDYGSMGQEEYKKVFDYMKNGLQLDVYSSKRFCEEYKIT